MLALKLLAVFLMGAAVGILYRVPRSLLLYGSLNAMLAWLAMYGFAGYGGNAIGANFCGGLMVGLVAELLARLLRKPATIFVIPGFIPLVPGREAFMTMRFFVEREYSQAVAMGAQTLFIAGAIAFGIFVSVTVYRLILTYQKKESGIGYADKG